MESCVSNWDMFIENLPEPPMPNGQQRYIFFEEYEGSKVLKENVWAYKRSRMNGGADGCYVFSILKTTMYMYIAYCRPPSNLKDMRSSFKKGIAAELSFDASIRAAAQATPKGRGNDNTSKGGGKGNATQSTSKRVML